MSERLGREIEAPGEPQETLGGDVLFGLELVDDEGLEGLRVSGGSGLPVAQLLDVAVHVGFYGLEGCGAEDVCGLG